MPLLRNAASCECEICAPGSAATSAGAAGNDPGNINDGTEGDCTFWVDAVTCPQCQAHSAGACLACAIGMPVQCSLIAMLPFGMSARAQIYDASAACWNSSAKMASTARRSRKRRRGRRSDFTARLYRKAAGLCACRVAFSSAIATALLTWCCSCWHLEDQARPIGTSMTDTTSTYMTSAGAAGSRITEAASNL